MLESAFAWLAAGAGLVAAGLWFCACFVRVSYEPVVEPGGWEESSVIVIDDKGRRTDPFATAAKANRWNAWAAGVTAGAALLQAASLAAHQLGR